MTTTLIVANIHTLHQLLAERGRTDQQLADLSPDDQAKLVERYNAQAKRYNFLRMWDYLTKRYKDGQGWCSFRGMFEPADPAGPFFALEIKRVQESGGVLKSEEFCLYMTADLESRDKQCGGTYLHTVLPVVLVGDPPEATRGDMGTDKAKEFFGQHPAWLDHAKRPVDQMKYIFPDEVPEEEEELYGVPPFLELVKQP